MNISNKELIVFDLDGTLAESKSVMDEEMSVILSRLLQSKIVAIIGGGSHGQFIKQFLAGLSAEKDLLTKLHLFPTCAAQYYRHDGSEWIEQYADRLSSEEKQKIMAAFHETFEEAGYVIPKYSYGTIVEDRGTQITFSAVGQEAPVEVKKSWNEINNELRLEIMRMMQRRLPEFEVRVGGMTSIDVTRKGIDKAYGIRKIEDLLGINKDRMVFIGDALYPGGNDEPVKFIGVECVAVNNPEETKKIINKWLLDKE